MMSRFFREDESQAVIEGTRSRIHLQNREDKPALTGKRVFSQLSCKDCTETLSSMLGGYAECVQLNVPSRLNCHKKADAHTFRIEWPPVPEAVRHVIRRNGAPDLVIDPNAGFLQGDRFVYTAIGRRPSTLHTYSVEAQFAAPTPPTRSPVSQVVTQQASPPQGFHATVSGPGAVTLTWLPRVEATSYRIIRTGGPLPAATLNPMGILYLDQNLPTGHYTYVIYSVIKLASGEEFDGEVSNPVTITFRPFNMIAVGDSVMWGQGLLPQNKFAVKIQAWIQGLLEILVTLNWKAHSGAITYPDPGKPVCEDRSYDGEVPADWPTISHQLGLASSPSVPNPAAASDVDLILIDGCANNIGIITVLNPAGNDNTVRADTRGYCGARMTNLHSDAVMKYPSANIVVTGYFRYVSSDSDLAALIPVFSILGAFIPPDPLVGGVAVQVSGQTSQPLTYPPCVLRPPNGRVTVAPGGADEPCAGRDHVPFYPDVSFEDVSVKKLAIPPRNRIPAELNTQRPR